MLSIPVFESWLEVICIGRMGWKIDWLFMGLLGCLEDKGEWINENELVVLDIFQESQASSMLGL